MAKILRVRDSQEGGEWEYIGLEMVTLKVERLRE